MKKIVSFIAAFVVLTTASCTSKKDSDSVSSTVEQAIEVTQTMYKENYGQFPEDCYSVACLGYVDGSGVRLVYTTKDKKVRYADYSDGDTPSSSRDLFAAKESFSSNFSISTDGSILALMQYIDSDAEMFSDEYYENGQQRFELHKFNADGEETVMEIPKLAEYIAFPDDIVNEVSAVGENVLVYTMDSVFVIDENGDVTDSWENGNRIRYCEDADGRIIAAGMKGYMYIDKLGAVDTSEMTEYGEYLTLQQGISTGSGGFKAFFMLNNGVFGLTGGEVVKIMDYTSSLMSCADYYIVSYAGKGRFTGFGYDDGAPLLSFMDVRPEGYVMNRENVVLARVGLLDTDMNEMASKYNKKSDKYQVSWKSYSDFDALKEAILTEDSPDVYCFWDTSELNKLYNLGALCNMYELSEKYGGFKKDELMDNVAASYEYKGGLYMMTQTFGISPYIGTKKNFPKSDITFDEFYEIVEDAPEDVYLMNRMDCCEPKRIFDEFCAWNINSWIDLENCECDFDSPEFVKFLEFTKTAPILPKMDWDEFYDNSTDEEIRVFNTEETNRLYDGTSLLTISHGFGQFRDLDWLMRDLKLGLDEMTLLYPFGNGTTGYTYSSNFYSVVANGNCPEGGWDFINFLVDDNFLSTYLQTESGFVVKKKAFEANMERYFDELEETIKQGDSYAAPNDEGEFVPVYSIRKPVTREEMNELIDYISSCTQLETNCNDIIDILDEEYDYFDSGEHTAEECAKYIQDRVSIYLSEIS